MLAPAWERCERLISLDAEDLKGRQQYEAVAGDRESGMARASRRMADLGLADSEEVFFVAMLDLDLPAVVVGLNQQGGRRGEFGGEEVSRVAIADALPPLGTVGSGGENDQPQEASSGSMLPEDTGQEFAADHPITAGEVDSHLPIGEGGR